MSTKAVGKFTRQGYTNGTFRTNHYVNVVDYLGLKDMFMPPEAPLESRPDENPPGIPGFNMTWLRVFADNSKLLRKVWGPANFTFVNEGMLWLWARQINDSVVFVCSGRVGTDFEFLKVGKDPTGDIKSLMNEILDMYEGK